MATGLFDTSMFDPFADFGGLGGGGYGGSRGGNVGGNVGALRLDLYETQNEFKLLLDCPGVDAEGLNIECEGNVLRVSCETKRDEEEARNAKWHRWERAGNMTATRSLRFPDSADMSKVDAKLDNGVLCVCIGKRAESQPRRLSIKSRHAAQRIGVEAEQPEQRREVIREAPRREEPRREEPHMAAAQPAVLLPVGVAEAAQPRAYEPSREHERPVGFAERETAAPKVGEKLESAGHGMREGLVEERPRREGALREEQRELGGGGAYRQGDVGSPIGTGIHRREEEKLAGYERGGREEQSGFYERTHAGEQLQRGGYEGGRSEGIAVMPAQAVVEGRQPQAVPMEHEKGGAVGKAFGREESYESRGAGGGTYGERAAGGDIGRERIGGEHIGVRATREDEFGRESRGAGREGAAAGREEGVAKVMYTTRSEGGREGHRESYGREGREESYGRESYGEEEEHHRGIMGKMKDTMHHVGAKLTGKE